MIKPQFPNDEKQRLMELHQYEILDSDPESSFDDLTQLASQICNTKISLISLVDSDRQWFKSSVGLDAKETPRDISWCGHAILGEDIFEVPDSELDDRFKDNPLFLKEPCVRFYAGAPLITKSGHKIGTLCVIDREAKLLTEWQRSALKKLARQAVILIESRIREKKLMEANSKLDVIINNIPIILSGYDKNGDFEWVNNQWTKELGWKLEEMAGKNMLEEFYPDKTLKEKVLRFMTSKEEGWQDFYLRKKDGTYVYTSWTNTKLPSGQSLGIGKNIHQRKLVEQELQNNQEKVMAIYEGSNDAIMLLSPEGFFDCNRKALELFKVKDRGEFIKLHPSDLSPQTQPSGESSLVSAQEKINTAYKLGVNQFEWTHCKLSGENFPAEVLLSSFVYQGRQVLQATVRDISERKNLEESLKIQTKLSQHQAKLASLGQLAAGVGHEINNPLAIIKGYIFSIQDELKNERPEIESINKRMIKINSAADRIENIVKGLRTFSRSDENELELFCINDAIEESFNLIEDIYQKDGIDIKLNVTTVEKMSVFGNRGRIAQVLINLLSNAKDATDGKKNRTIVVTLAKEGDFAKVTIKDNGKGIPNSIKDKIFDPFFTTKEVNKGTGIGLSIVSSIVKEHAGEIYVDVGHDTGTAFTIEIPIGQKEAKQKLTLENIENNANEEIMLSALVVDDEEDLRSIIKILLERRGIKVTTVESGKIALEEYGKAHYDFILTDFKMPQMSGISLIEAIRSNPNIKQPKLILMTGDVDRQESEDIDTKKLIDAYLYKPFDEKTLYGKMVALFPEKAWK